MSGWGCPHEVRGTCARVLGRDCDPGMKGCILAGRFEFATESKNRPAKAPRRTACKPGGGKADNGSGA